MKACKKDVTIIARYFIKRNGAVVYACRGSKGDIYYTTLVDGHATGCTCPARKPCKHMNHCEGLEQKRVAQAAVAGDKTFDEAIYEALAPTKQPVSQIESRLAGLGMVRGKGGYLHGRAS